MALRGLIRPRWMVGSVVILLLALGIACGDDAAPAAPAPTVDVGAIAGQVQEALKIDTAAIEALVEKAVKAAVTPGVTTEEIEDIVMRGGRHAYAGAYGRSCSTRCRVPQGARGQTEVRWYPEAGRTGDFLILRPPSDQQHSQRVPTSADVRLAGADQPDQVGRYNPRPG